MRIAATVVVLVIGAVGLTAQHGYTRAEIENGARFYSSNCAACHGPRGDGVRGAALFSGSFRRAESDEGLVQLIMEGVPGTAMPPSSYSALEAGMIVAYLRGVAAGETVEGATGNPASGKAIFEGKGTCTSCHSPTSRLAPSLADVGVVRRPLDIETSILDPSAELHADFRFVRAVARSGTVVTGRLLNQSTFSVQILDRDERLQSFDRADLREVVLVRTSEMPPYRDRLDGQEVADLVAYLTSLRGAR